MNTNHWWQMIGQFHARLTEMLQPDIVVLEGGYSIQNALPYVNLGLILALAGLDISGVKEPDFDAAHFRESEATQTYTRKLVQLQWDVWQRRHDLLNERDQIFGQDDQFTRTRQVHYDSDGLLETREEIFYRCKTCPGIWEIISSGKSNFSQNHIQGIHIPGIACESCHSKGHSLFQAIQNKNNQKIMLQDNRDDIFLVR